MVIIFDGIDNSGKTTIAKALAKRLNIPYFKYSFVNKDLLLSENCNVVNENLELYSLKMLQVIDCNSIVIDRHFPSDFAYGIMLRDREESSLRKVEEELLKLDHLIVICYKDEVLMKDDSFVSKDTQSNADNLFKEFISWTKCNCLGLNTTDENLESQLDRILKYATQEHIGKKI